MNVVPESGIEAFVPFRSIRQIKLHIHQWFLSARTTSIAHRNQFFYQYKCDENPENKRPFRVARKKS